MNDQTLRRIRACLLLFVLVTVCCVWSHAALADDMERLGMPVFFGEEDDGYGLAIFEYGASTEGEFGRKQKVVHEIEFEALLRPSEDDDVIGFRTRLRTVEAINEDGKDIYAGEGKSNRELYSAVYARPQYQDRKGRPIDMANVELSQCELDEPGANVESLELEALAVIGKKRESEEFPAVVADRFLDVGNNVSIQVTAMEVKSEGVMLVKLDVKRSGGKRDAIVDSLYALNEDGDIIGGGRWINEIDIFGKHIEYEMLLFLDEEVTISKFRVELATKYEVVEVPIVVEKLYQ